MNIVDLPVMLLEWPSKRCNMWGGSLTVHTAIVLEGSKKVNKKLLTNLNVNTAITRKREHSIWSRRAFFIRSTSIKVIG